MYRLAALFVSLACKDLPLVEYAVEFTVLDRGKLPPPCWPLESAYPRSRAQPDPEPSPPSPQCAELKPKPPVDREPETATTDKPSQQAATELGLPRSWNGLWRPTRCECWPQCPPQGKWLWTVRALRGAPPIAPWLRVSW